MLDFDVPATQDDLDLEKRVIRFLETKHVPSLRHLIIKSRNGVVVLSGQVHTYYEKQLCNQCCGRVLGLEKLVNSVEVVELIPGAAVVA